MRTLRPGVDVTAREAGVARGSLHEPTRVVVTAVAERRGCTRVHRTNGCAGKYTGGGGVGVEWRGGVAGGPPGVHLMGALVEIAGGGVGVE